jgi:hypothetical protein
MKEQPATMPTVTTPATLLAMAVAQNADLGRLEQLMDLQVRWEANEARKAFHAAVAAFKANAPTITKDMENKQYGSTYTSLPNLVNTAAPELSKYGLSARWDISQEKAITVTCILSHVLGHSEQVSMSGPPDDSGKKNPLQQIKSTVTYLKITTFEAITGLASSDGNDDGNGAGPTAPTITEDQIADLESLIEEVKADRAAFLKWAKVSKPSEIHVNAYAGCVQALRHKGKK